LFKIISLIPWNNFKSKCCYISEQLKLVKLFISEDYPPRLTIHTVSGYSTVGPSGNFSFISIFEIFCTRMLNNKLALSPSIKFLILKESKWSKNGNFFLKVLKFLVKINNDCHIELVLKSNINYKARSHGPVVKVDGSWPRGCGFKPWHCILDGYKRC